MNHENNILYGSSHLNFHRSFLSLTNVAPIEFVIFVPSYNNEKYALGNLVSVCNQKSTNPYHVVLVTIVPLIKQAP